MRANRFAVGLVSLAALALAGCHSPASADSNSVTSITSDSAPTSGTGVVTDQVPSGLSADEARNITVGFQSLLAQLEYRNFSTGSRVTCASIYSLGVPVIKDSQLNGSSGKLRVAVQVTANQPYVERTPAGPVYTFFFPDACYGNTADNWHAGEVATAIYEVNIERWSSGWRLAQQQTLRTVAG